MEVTGLTIDPQNPQRLYAAQGKNSTVYYVSSDGGESWQTRSIHQTSVYHLHVHPTDARALVAVTSGGVYFSGNQGESWQKADTGPEEAIGQYWQENVVRHPTNPQLLYAVLRVQKRVNGLPVGFPALFRSSDGGRSYRLLRQWDKPYGLVTLAVTRAAPDRLYAFVAKSWDEFDALYLSTEQGDNLRPITTDATPVNSPVQTRNGRPSTVGYWLGERQYTYDWAVSVSPTDTSRLSIGAINFLQTTDGGRSWTFATIYRQSSVSNVHVDIQALAYHPITRKLYIGCDGGLYREPVAGGRLEALNDGRSAGLLYRLGQDPTRPDRWAMGHQDNGAMLSHPAGLFHLLNGDGMDILFAATSRTIYAALLGSLYRVEFDENSGSFRDLALISPQRTELAQWATPMVLYPNDDNKLLIGYENVWKTANAGRTWTRLEIPRTEKQPLGIVRVAPSDTSVIVASSGWLETISLTPVRQTTVLYRTVDGGRSWKALPVGEPSFHTLQDVAIHPTRPEIMWATGSGGKVYKTTDAGETWQDYSGSLPNLMGTSIVCRLTDREELFLGMDRGVYYRDGTMNDWVLYGQGLPNVAISELEINPHHSGTLRVATFGRGVWEVDLPRQGPRAISTLPLSASAGCPGNALLVPFSLAGEWEAGSSFRAELSDAAGSFRQPLALGSGTASPIRVVLPTNLAGATFQIRVVSADGRVVGTPSRVSYTQFIATPPTVRSLTVCAGTDVYLTQLAEGADLRWYDRPTGGTHYTGFPGLVPGFSVKRDTTLFVSQFSNGCESERRAVEIRTLARSKPPQVAARVSVCLGEKPQPLTAVGQQLKWYDKDRNPLSEAPKPPTDDPNQIRWYFVSLQESGSACPSELVPIRVDVEGPPQGRMLVHGSVTINQLEEVPIELWLTGQAPWTIVDSEGQTIRVDTSRYIYKISPPRSTVYRIQSVQNRCGTGSVFGQLDITVIPVLGESGDPLPKTPALLQNEPNPAVGQTLIRFGLPKKERVQLRLLSIDGRMIRKLSEGVYPAGWHALEVNTAVLPAGVYLYELRTSSATLTRRMVVNR